MTNPVHAGAEGAPAYTPLPDAPANSRSGAARRTRRLLGHIVLSVIIAALVWAVALTAAERFSEQGRAIYAALNGLGMLAYLQFLDWYDARNPAPESRTPEEWERGD